MLSINQLEFVMPDYEKKSVADRERYKSVYNCIENYIAKYSSYNESAIIVGGNMGLNISLGNPKSLKDYSYLLYTEKAFIHANNLANTIDEELSKLKEPEMNWSVILKTKSQSTKYVIFIDERAIVEITGLRAMSANAKLVDVIKPQEMQSFDKEKKFLILPPLFRLMDIYRSLYSPIFAGKWENLLKIEKTIVSALTKEQIVGGKDNKIMITPAKRMKINNLIIHYLLTDNDDFILIGEYALRILANSKIENYILQTIFASSGETLKNNELMERILPSISKKIISVIGNVPINYTVRDVRAMEDTRLSRISIRVEINGNQREIMYIYNINYDLIPYNKIFMQKGKHYILVGDPFVIMRFLLIDIWIIRDTLSIGKIDRQFAEERLAKLTSKYLSFRKILESIKHDGLRIFNKEYAGFYDDELIAQKKALQHQSKRFGDYNPRQTLKERGEYRKIGELD